MADLFDIDDLAAYLHVETVDLDTATAARARRYASGWLKSATRLADWPDPIPDDLWAWAIELAAIAYSNPSGMATESIDDWSGTWDRARRSDILAAARATYAGTGAPSYEFPEPDWHWTSVTTTTASTD